MRRLCTSEVHGLFLAFSLQSEGVVRASSEQVWLSATFLPFHRLTTLSQTQRSCPEELVPDSLFENWLRD